MNYNILLDMLAEYGYRLAMCGAETFRVEEGIGHILRTYGVSGEVFAIPNCITVSIETAEGKPMTRMRRVGSHGNDLDAVERFSSLGRKICREKPTPEEAMQWLKDTENSRIHYSTLIHLLGNFLGSFGFAIFFNGDLIDALCAGVCGIVVGLVSRFMNRLETNEFFRTLTNAFMLSLVAYILGILGIAHNTDAVIIGTLMILVPGLLFTNAMRDIIFGDTNSGMNRIIQVLMIAAAIALGTGTAWNLVRALWATPVNLLALEHNYLMLAIGCFIGCVGFFILFNIHGPGGFLCALGGVLAWSTYYLVVKFGGGEILGYFLAGITASTYAEIMARIRKFPAISYLVISIFPLIPGAGIYYTTNYLVQGNAEKFAERGSLTIGIAGALAVGIILVATLFRLYRVWQIKIKKR